MKKKSKKKAKKDREFVTILGINVLSSSTGSLLARVEDLISHSVKFSILTPNSELVLMAQNNKSLKDALNCADFPIPDSVGLDYASRYLSGKSLYIIPGRTLFMDLVDLAAQKSWKVFLLGGADDEARLTEVKLKNLYPGLKIKSFKGPKLDTNAIPVTEIDRKSQKDAIDKINRFTPELLFVAFGNPKQEIWIHKNISRLKIGGAMAVGGTFRYIAGYSKLPPKWLSQIGLEWLWRLITEPSRLGRVLNATFVFPWKVFLFKINNLY